MKNVIVQNKYQNQLKLFKQKIDNLTEKPENRIKPLDNKTLPNLPEILNPRANTAPYAAFISSPFNTPKC